MFNTKDTPMDYKQFEGHTPGQWSTGNINGTDVVFDPNRFCVCEVSYQEGGNKANAKLIAAAPDLLKENQELKLELQKLNDYISASEQFNATQSQSYRDTISKMKLELQKQKEFKKQILRSAFKAGGGYARNEQWPDFEEWYESLIKKSSEI